MQWELVDVNDTCRCAVIIPAVHICIPRVRIIRQCKSDFMDVKCWLRVSPEIILDDSSRLFECVVICNIKLFEEHQLCKRL